MTHVHDAVILGGGYGGLGVAATLKSHGVDDFVLLERAPRIGGVWRDNTYPGAACDTQSVIYCYSYFLHTEVTKMYAGQEELLGYLERLVESFGLQPHIRTGTEVVFAGWDDERKIWAISDSAGEEYLARVFIPAWGQLGTPLIPNVPGRDDFAGESFHSARWRHDVDLTGKRVASIGAAASAVQYVPEVAKVAGHLTVFQRSANYILPRNQHVFTPEERQQFIDDQQTFIKLRTDIHNLREAGFARTRVGTNEQDAGVTEARAHLASQVADEELRRKLTPDYEFGCKRILRSDDYYPALMRDNVSLETSSIERITPEGIVTADGRLHEVDVIIWGTGFLSQSFQGEVRITGRDGVSLDERWKDSPEAYLGMAVDGFPNMLIVYGPNTNLNHNSIVTMLEAQDEYISQVVHLVRDGADAFDVSPEALRKFNDHVQSELSRSAYSSDCSSWYKNAAGKVINNWSGTVEEYRALTHEPDLHAYAASR